MALTDIKLLVFDVDGVLTDGRLYYGPEGDELKAFSARDGAGLKYLMRAGLQCGILSGRDSTALQRRCEDLGITHVITGAKFKEPELLKLLESLKLSPTEAGYVGDDLMDLPPMRLAGWSACPADAVEEVRAAADYVASARGGRGAAREVVEHLLKAQGKWDSIMERYRGE
jgi:3-deoxy-D-manno-octulosonate 8-phosphate phosphatase (KDO 8-P phosphatase)